MGKGSDLSWARRSGTRLGKARAYHDRAGSRNADHATAMICIGLRSPLASRPQPA